MDGPGTDERRGGLSAHVRESERLAEASGWRLPVPLSLLLAFVHALLTALIALYGSTVLDPGAATEYWRGPGLAGLSLADISVSVTIVLMLFVPIDFLRWRATGRGRPWLHLAALVLLGSMLARLVPLTGPPA